jgi:hypothetical protein
LPKRSLRSRSASTAADALGGNRFLLHAKSAASVSPRLAAMAILSSAPSYIMRLAPSPAKGNARCAASVDINQEYSPRPLYQRLLKAPNRFRHNVDIDLHKTTHDMLEFAFAEIACSPNASQCAAINSQSRARQAIRLVEISSFVENAPLKIEVICFASVTFVWHSPCISRYCRNVDSQIQPMMSCQRSTMNGPVSSHP